MKWQLTKKTEQQKTTLESWLKKLFSTILSIDITVIICTTDTSVCIYFSKLLVFILLTKKLYFHLKPYCTAFDVISLNYNWQSASLKIPDWKCSIYKKNKKKNQHEVPRVALTCS